MNKYSLLFRKLFLWPSLAPRVQNQIQNIFHNYIYSYMSLVSLNLNILHMATLKSDAFKLQYHIL